MRLHRNARTCPAGRRSLVDRVVVEGWSVARAAAAAGISERSASKWLSRFRLEGVAGLEDRSSRALPGAAQDAAGSGGGDRGASSCAADWR
jgi:DNA-directed RNA polymerase specialized sigma24 family protein